MSKNLLIGIVIVVLLLVGAASVYVLRPTAEASAPIEAISVEAAESSTDAQAEMPESDGDSSSAPQDAILFTILQAESEVRFSLGELLGGVPTTVVGVTDQVAGEIVIDPADPASSKVGVFQVNARTFTTDNNFRNRAINNSILETGTYEFVTFTPVEIIGFPENPAVGEALEFQILGDLTVRDTTHPITFDLSVTAVSETRLEGSAAATLQRSDFGLNIPEVPRVADVDEEVLLELDFAAVTK